MTLYYYSIGDNQSIKKFENIGWKNCILTDFEKKIVNNIEVNYINILERVKIIINSVLRITAKSINNILLLGDGYITPYNTLEYWKYNTNIKNNTYNIKYEINNKVRKDFSDSLNMSFNIENYGLPCCSFNSFFSLYDQLILIKNKSYNKYDLIFLIKCGIFDKISDQTLNKLKALTKMVLFCKKK